MRLCARAFKKYKETLVTTLLLGANGFCLNQRRLFVVHVMHIEDWL
jgi:hypothetical protein